MKKALQLLFAMAVLSLTAFTTYAQGGPGGGPMGGGMNPEQRVERQTVMMQDSLELSDELTADVKEVLTIYSKKMMEARMEAKGDWASIRNTMQNLRQEQNEELAAILGEEKWSQWEVVSAKMMERRQERRGQRQGKGKKKGKKNDTRTDNN